ncbi:MAG: helix-turn-helix domain-containing protein [Candidatus Aenigmatarchaeota archaeon]
MKVDLIRDLKRFLEERGYDTFEYFRGCFDLAAKREKLLLIKVLGNVDSFKEGQARDLKVLTESLSASAIITGERTRKEKLKEGIIYERFGIPVLHPETLKNTVKGNHPTKFRSRGGTFGKIDPERLKDFRKRKNLTQEELAEKLGVSQKNISEHERYSEKAQYSMIRLGEKVLGEEIKERINPLDQEVNGLVEEKGKPEFKEVGRCMQRTGFKIRYTERAPPQILAEKEVTVLSRFDSDKKRLKRKSEELKKFSSISGSPAFMVAKEKVESKVPVLLKNELNRIKSSEELLKIIEEKKGV